MGGGRRLSPTLLPKAKSYIYGRREHPDTAALPFKHKPSSATLCDLCGSALKISSTTADLRFNGLVPGKRYAFRIRAHGPNDELESPWSDEVSCMAP